MNRISAEAKVVASAKSIIVTVRLQNEEDTEVYLSDRSFNVGSCIAALEIYGSTTGFACHVACSRGPKHSLVLKALPPHSCIEVFEDVSRECGFASGVVGDSHGLLIASVMYYGTDSSHEPVGIIHHSLPWFLEH